MANKKEDLKKFTTEELDLLFVSLDDQNSKLRDQIADEIRRRVKKISNAKKEE